MFFKKFSLEKYFFVEDERGEMDTERLERVDQIQRWKWWVPGNWKDEVEKILETHGLQSLNVNEQIKILWGNKNKYNNWAVKQRRNLWKEDSGRGFPKKIQDLQSNLGKWVFYQQFAVHVSPDGTKPKRNGKQKKKKDRSVLFCKLKFCN